MTIDLTNAELATVQGLVELWQYGRTNVMLTTYLSYWLPKQEGQCGVRVAKYLASVHSKLTSEGQAAYPFESDEAFKEDLINNLESIISKEQVNAQAEFDAIGRKMAQVTSREALVQLGRKRASLAIALDMPISYENHCWQCKGHISSAIRARCPSCGRYICTCGACQPHCSGYTSSSSQC